MEQSLSLPRPVQTWKKPGAEFRPWGCTINGLVDPVGLKAERMKFAWRLPAGMANQEQYEIRTWRESSDLERVELKQAGKSPEAFAFWDAPEIWTHESQWLSWQVRCQDGTGRWTGWSEEARAYLRGASMAPTRWLGGAGYHFLRKVFELGDPPIARAALVVAADAHSYAREHWDSMDEPGKPAENWMFGGSHIKYRAFLNGELIALGPPRSVGSNPVAQGFDVTDQLVAGENTLGFIILGEARGVAAMLHIMDVEGNEYTVVTDPSWCALPAETIFRSFCWERPGMDHYFKGFAGPGVMPEHIDGSRWPNGWLEANFDDSSWERPVEHGEAGGPYEDAGLPPYEFRELAFQTARKLEPGRFCFDAGKQIFGSIRIELSKGVGGEIELRLGEELREDGSVRYRLRTENCYQEVWKLPPVPASLEHLGCRAFRYAEIIGLPEDFPLENIKITVPEYPWDDTQSAFHCSNARLARVWDFCRYSIRATNFDIYTDCLSRERQPYEGDAYVTALSHYATQSDSLLARRTFEYLVNHPTWPQEWALMMPMLLWLDYWQTGDPSLARRQAQTMWERLGPLLNGAGLVEQFPSPLLIDWPATTRDGYEFGPASAVPNAYLHEALRCMEHLLLLAARKGDAAKVNERASSLRRAFHESLFDGRESLYVDHVGSNHASFHANLYALRFGLVPMEHRARIVCYLARRGMVGSVFTAQFFLETLFAFGEARVAVDWMTRDGVPGWLAMMDVFGATIGMEAWSPEEKRNVSFGHPWASAPANVVASGLFGLRAASPGWKTFVFDPQPGGVASAELRLPTPHGMIEASWRTSADGTLSASVRAPESCHRVEAGCFKSIPAPGWLGYSFL